MRRAPTVKRGDRLTTELWNDMAGVVNESIAAPRDLDAGVTADEIGTASEHEVSREVTVERVTSPDDENVYVDVNRITALTVRDASGVTKTTYFLA